MAPARQKTKLSVNLNKVATLRNARGKNTPDLIRIARIVLQFPVGGITVHPRPDGRHIKTRDVFDLKALLQERPDKEYNIEGRPEPDFLKLIEKVRPRQCTLVPDPPNALTSNAGWDFVKHKQWLKSAALRLKEIGVRSSLFLDPLSMSDSQYEALREIAPERIELFTEHYAESHARKGGSSAEAQGPVSPVESLARKGASQALPHEEGRIGKTPFDKRGYGQILSLYKECASQLTAEGIGLNAGHDLNQSNLLDFLQAVPQTQEVSIGQALIAKALEEGLPRAIQNCLDLIDKAFVL